LLHATANPKVEPAVLDVVDTELDARSGL
jgi:hypothetical protein